MDDHRDLIQRYWDTANARDWDGFALTMSPDVVYLLPQTRERTVGRELFVRFNREYPGDWRIEVRRILTDATGGVSVIELADGADSQPAVNIFTIVDGAITEIEDLWPEPYEPPAGREHLTERY